MPMHKAMKALATSSRPISASRVKTAAASALDNVKVQGLSSSIDLARRKQNQKAVRYMQGLDAAGACAVESIGVTNMVGVGGVICDSRHDVLRVRGVQSSLRSLSLEMRFTAFLLCIEKREAAQTNNKEATPTQCNVSPPAHLSWRVDCSVQTWVDEITWFLGSVAIFPWWHGLTRRCFRSSSLCTLQAEVFSLVQQRAVAQQLRPFLSSTLGSQAPRVVSCRWHTQNKDAHVECRVAGRYGVGAQQYRGPLFLNRKSVRACRPTRKDDPLVPPVFFQYFIRV